MAMGAKEQLQQTIMRFELEVERVRAASFVDMPRPLVLLVDAIESEPIVSAFIATCHEERLGSTFDAAAEVDRVETEDAQVFGPLEAGETGAAQAFAIVRELVARRTRFSSGVFSGYGSPQGRLAERADAFAEELIEPLIACVQEHLAALAQEAGLSDAGDVGPEEAATSEACGQADSLDAELRGLERAAGMLPTDVREDALMQLEALSEELACDRPKPRVVRVLLRGLRLLGAGAAFDAAVGQLEAAAERELG